MLATLAGQPTPRVPTGPLAVHFCAGLAGRTLRDYSTSARTLAECVIRYYERFRPDAVWVSADTWVSAEAMGARVGAADAGQPLGGLGEPLVHSPADLERIPPPDPGSQGRYPMMLEALGLIVNALGREAWVVACLDQFPFSLAAGLMGINQIMLKLVTDRPFVEALMERAREYAVAYGLALAGAGADMLSGGDSPAGLIGPELYARLAQPFEKRVIAELQARGGKPVSLHICGNATPLLPAMTATGADVLELDHLVDLGEACRVVGPNVTLWGNLDPVGILARSGVAEVERAARRAIAHVHDAGRRRFVLSSGCTLAMETPLANMDALMKERTWTSCD